MSVSRPIQLQALEGFNKVDDDKNLFHCCPGRETQEGDRTLILTLNPQNVVLFNTNDPSGKVISSWFASKFDPLTSKLIYDPNMDKFFCVLSHKKLIWFQDTSETRLDKIEAQFEVEKRIFNLDSEFVIYEDGNIQSIKQITEKGHESQGSEAGFTPNFTLFEASVLNFKSRQYLVRALKDKERNSAIVVQILRLKFDPETQDVEVSLVNEEGLRKNCEFKGVFNSCFGPLMTLVDQEGILTCFSLLDKGHEQQFKLSLPINFKGSQRLTMTSADPEYLAILCQEKADDERLCQNFYLVNIKYSVIVCQVADIFPEMQISKKKGLIVNDQIGGSFFIKSGKKEMAQITVTDIPRDLDSMIGMKTPFSEQHKKPDVKIISKTKVVQDIEYVSNNNSCCSLYETLPKHFQKHNVQAVSKILEEEKDIPEFLLLSIIEFILNAPEKKIIKSRKSSSDPDLATVERERMLKKAFEVPFTGPLMFQYLSQIEFDVALKMLKYLDLALKLQSGDAAFSKYVDWTSLILDAHYTKIVVTKNSEALDLLDSISDTVEMFKEDFNNHMSLMPLGNLISGKKLPTQCALTNQGALQQARTGVSGGDRGWQPMAGPIWNSVIDNSISEKKNHSSTRFPVSGLPTSGLPTSGLPASGLPAMGLNGSVTSKQMPFCSTCGKPHIAESRCQVCKENLCKDCVFAHQRVKLTRDHLIVDLRSLQSQNEPTKSRSSHFDNLAISSPDPKQLSTISQNHADVARVYFNAVEEAEAERQTLTSTAQQLISQIEEAEANVKEMENRINAKCNLSVNDVKGVTQKYMTTINERETVLANNVDKIRNEKLRILDNQKKKLVNATTVLHSINDQLMGAKGKDMELINVCKESQSRLKNVQAICGSLEVNEDDVMEFSPPDPMLLKKLTIFGSITGSGYGPNSRAEGEGLKKGILGKCLKFEIIVKDQAGEKRNVGGDNVMVAITSPDQSVKRDKPIDCNNGTYIATWKPKIEGEHVISVTIKGVDIYGSPFKVRIHAGRNYDKIGMPIFEVGGQGEADGQLCRPWGVCCSREGLIIVANRSNNRIEMYTPEGKFHRKFGGSGQLDGQFNRPASVCCDSKDRIVVADKDNHRIQIFTIDGKFLMAFGERGSKLGQFHYPWDVACNSKDEILVSDTRNHRIQLFSPNGEYLNKYGFEGSMWKHFDSPRGVCFTSDDLPVVTDFNNHRVLIIKAGFQKAQFLGKEGSDDLMFTRPSGIAVDEEGRIIVADCRNDRVQIFSSSGVFIKKFGTKGTGPGEFDRPSGICISPKGHVIVVDLGNNRVQVF